jgi:hypothetical protein
MQRATMAEKDIILPTSSSPFSDTDGRKGPAAGAEGTSSEGSFSAADTKVWTKEIALAVDAQAAADTTKTSQNAETAADAAKATTNAASRTHTHCPCDFKRLWLSRFKIFKIAAARQRLLNELHWQK